MIETVYWNWVSQLFGFICFITYYVMVIAMNMHFLSPLIQPEIDGEFFMVFMNAKAWIILIVMPFVALLPDIAILLLQKVFWPTPTDAVMLK